MRYEIPSEATDYLCIGKWVEIMESYDCREENDSIKVRAMRVGSRLLAFTDRSKQETKPLRPHEGQITFIEDGPITTLFGIQLR